MATYIISYDLRKVRDYKSLYEAIDVFSKKAKVLESLWAINTTNTAVQLRDNLSQYMDNDDWLFIIKSWGESAWKKVLCSNEWLKENL